MTFTKPMRIEEGAERELLKEWEWDHDLVQLDSAAVRGANVLLDQIKQDAEMFLYADDANVTAQITLFGEYYLVFDITDDLKALAEDDMSNYGRLPWEFEFQDRRALSSLFKSIAAEIDNSIDKLRENGTLDQKLGMSYEEWAAAGKPPIPK
jgi:hypothetical protein